MNKKTKNKIVKISGISIAVILVAIAVYFIYGKVSTGATVVEQFEFKGLTWDGTRLVESGQTSIINVEPDEIEIYIVGRDQGVLGSHGNIKTDLPENIKEISFDVECSLKVVGGNDNSGCAINLDGQSIFSHTLFAYSGSSSTVGTSVLIKKVGEDFYAFVGLLNRNLHKDDLNGVELQIGGSAGADIGSPSTQITLSNFEIQYESDEPQDDEPQDDEQKTSKTPYVVVGGGVVGILGILGVIFRKSIKSLF